MCDPVSLAASTFALSAGQAGLGFMQQQQSANLQNEYQAANQAAVQQSLVNQYAGDGLQLQEQRAQAGQATLENNLKAAEARGTAAAAAGSAGLGGVSLDSILQDHTARQGRYNADVARNYAGNVGFNAATQQAQYDQGISRINSVQTAVDPSPLNLGLGIASAAVAGAGQYQAGIYRSRQSPNQTQVVT